MLRRITSNIIFAIAILALSYLSLLFTGILYSEPHTLSTSWQLVVLYHLGMAIAAFLAFRYCAKTTNKIVYVIVGIIFCLFALFSLLYLLLLLEDKNNFPYSIALPISYLVFLSITAWLHKTYNPFTHTRKLTDVSPGV